MQLDSTKKQASLKVRLALMPATGSSTPKLSLFLSLSLIADLWTSQYLILKNF